MVKLKSLLFEERRRSSEISKGEAVEVYKRKCKSHSTINRQIWRGTNAAFNSGVGVVRPKKSVRKTTGEKGNHHTVLLDNMENWSKYPKRSRSVICTMDYNVANGYGTPYVVIPFDGAKIGVCPNDDIWYSFRLGLEEVFGLSGMDGSLPSLNKSIDILYHVLKSDDPSGYLKSKKTSDNNFSNLKKELKEITNNIKSVYQKMRNYGEDDVILSEEINFKIAFKVAEKVKESSHSFYQLIQKALDPVLNNFNIKEYKKGFKTYNKESEVWTESPCLLIKGNYYDDFIAKLKD